MEAALMESGKKQRPLSLQAEEEAKKQSLVIIIIARHSGREPLCSFYLFFPFSLLFLSLLCWFSRSCLCSSAAGRARPTALQCVSHQNRHDQTRGKKKKQTYHVHPFIHAPSFFPSSHPFIRMPSIRSFILFLRSSFSFSALV